MRLGGRLAAAIEVLDDIERRHRPAADALKDWGLSHRFAGAADRAAIGNIVYDALRRKRTAGWLFDADTPRAIGFGALILESGHEPRALNAMLDGDRFAPPMLDDAELTLATQRHAENPPEAVRSELPDWTISLFRAAFGDSWVEEGAALAARPPLDLRVNTLKADRDKLLSELGYLGAAPMRLAPQGIRIPPIAGDGRHPNVQVEPAFQKGWFEVQDEGSQLAALLAGATSSMQVLDYCAGAGGKTLALSAAMDNRGQIFAHDSDKARLAPIFDRLTRAGARNVQVVAGKKGLDGHEAAMDLVLIDAPCTGAGTWRRRPDAKWRLSERQLGIRQSEQERILDEAARFVKPGGRLAYVTCSVFRAENERQIETFLARNRAFARVDHFRLWEIACPLQPGPVRIGEYGLTLTPARSGTDGFFVAMLERAA